jgi:hypothetical protein
METVVASDIEEKLRESSLPAMDNSVTEKCEHCWLRYGCALNV